MRGIDGMNIGMPPPKNFLGFILQPMDRSAPDVRAKRTTLVKAKEHAEQHFARLPAHLRPDCVGAIRHSVAFNGADAPENNAPPEFAQNACGNK